MGYFNPTGWLVELGILARPPRPAALRPEATCTAAWRVIYATQMGAAEALAHETAAYLRQTGATAELLAFDLLPSTGLASAQPTLLIASTSYDGDAPDMAEEFETQHMRQLSALGGLRYGLLSLGDRGYADFCGFGRRLHAWLTACGAQPLFPPIEVDDEDPAALLSWQQRVAEQVSSLRRRKFLGQF